MPAREPGIELRRLEDENRMLRGANARLQAELALRGNDIARQTDALVIAGHQIAAARARIAALEEALAATTTEEPTP